MTQKVVAFAGILAMKINKSGKHSWLVNTFNCLSALPQQALQ
jgi:hypothetical protein